MAAKIALNPFVQMMYDTDMAFVIADVADSAEANYYKVATTNGLHGKNYLLSSETYKVSDMVRC
jgi:dihydroflavonol-4-reductase